MKKIAIIGASTGQLPLCMKAKELGYEVFCFAWEEGAVCKKVSDHFIPISIFEKDKIYNFCKEHCIDAVVSNASERIVPIVSYIAEKLDLICTPYQNIINIQNKYYVRNVTNEIQDLGKVKSLKGSYNELMNFFPRPFVLKPIKGSAKIGVNFIEESTETVDIPNDIKENTFIAEEYIPGKEYSVESLSYKGKHQVVQITEKISTGAPHFVELEHHQPAMLGDDISEKITSLVPQILTRVGFINGASHVEIKISDDGTIYLVEVNPRGGGDNISNILTSLSTDCDYLKQIIQIALGDFIFTEIHNKSFAGIYYLSAHSNRLMDIFKMPKQEWEFERHLNNNNLTYSCSNFDRDGYIIYNSNKKIII